MPARQTLEQRTLADDLCTGWLVEGQVDDPLAMAIGTGHQPIVRPHRDIVCHRTKRRCHAIIPVSVLSVQDVTVLNVFRDTATMLFRSAPFVEYLLLARFGDRWLILNALYYVLGWPMEIHPRRLR